MSWYLEEKLFSLTESSHRNANLQDMKKFLTLWNCLCGICVVCKACLEVADLIEEEE